MKNKNNHHGGTPLGKKPHGRNLHGKMKASGQKIGRLKNQRTRPAHRRPPGSRAQNHHLGGKKRVSRKEGNHEVPQQQMLFCKGRPLLKKNRKDCEGRPYAKICKRQLLLFLRGATLRLYCKGRPYADLARGDPTLILQEATPAAVVLTILLILSLFFSEPCRKTLFATV